MAANSNLLKNIHPDSVGYENFFLFILSLQGKIFDAKSSVVLK